MERIASRRAVIAGASVAVGALAAGAWWRRGAAMLFTNDTVAVVAGREAPPLAIGPHAADLARLVGQTVRIAGEAGPATATLVAAQPLLSRGNRPAGVRPVPFSLTFLTDRLGAPVGGATYPVGTSIDGLDRLFLIRGADRGDQAALIAIVN